MASVFGFTDPSSNVEYSITTGNVREFELRGVVLFDEAKGIAADGWRDALARFVVEFHLNNERYQRHGLHAFVYKLIDDGMVERVGTKVKELH